MPRAREAISLPQMLRACVHFLSARVLGGIHKSQITVTRLLGEGVVWAQTAGAALEGLHLKSGRK